MKNLWKSAALVVAAGLVGICLFTGCSGTYSYSHAGKYTAGSGSVSSAGVSEISVDWIGGDITVRTADTDTITFTEETDEADTDYLLRYAVIGGELEIKFQKSGTKNKNNFKKELMITVPQNQSFRVLEIESVSGDINVQSVTATEFDLESVSGDIILTDNTVKTLKAESVSGDIVLSGLTASQTDLETVSGDISVLFDAADFRIRFETTSGKIKNLCGAAQSGKNYSMGSGSVFVEAETVSGDLTIDVKPQSEQ